MSTLLTIRDWLFVLLQGLGLAIFAFAFVLFRTKQYKREFVLFGLSGLTMILLGSCSRL